MEPDLVALVHAFHVPALAPVPVPVEVLQAAPKRVSMNVEIVVHLMIRHSLKPDATNSTAKQITITENRGITMAFPDDVVKRAWQRSGGRCECRQPKHKHEGTRCNKELSFSARGKEEKGRWEAHHIISGYGDTFYNCEILCADCYKQTFYK